MNGRELDLETAVIAYVVQHPEAIWDERLESVLLHRREHRAIYAAISELVLRDREAIVDQIILHQRLRETASDVSAAYLAELTLVEAVAFPSLVRELRELRQREEAQRIAGTLYEELKNPAQPIRESVEEAIVRLAPIARGAARLEVRSYAELEAAEAAKALRGEPTAALVATPWEKLDRLCGGVPRRMLTIVGGRPGRGKSAMLQQLAEHVATDGGRALLATPEMPGSEVAQRGLARSARIDLRDLRHASLVPAEREALGCLRRPPRDLFVFDRRPQSTRDIALVAHRLAAERPLDLLAVDYVQYLADKRLRGEDRYEQLGRVVRSLRDLAAELDCALVVGAQLKRDAEDRLPQLGDLRESGDLEQDADVVWLIGNLTTDGTVPVHVAKHRQGPTGIVYVRWTARFAAFEEDANTTRQVTMGELRS